MKIIITGALGFVGTNLCLHFLSLGNQIIGIDNKFKHLGGEANLQLITKKGADFKYIDIRNNNDVEFFFRNEKNIDVILHMAAQVAFKHSIENPRLDFEINALGTLNLLEAVRIYHPLSFFLCASTNQVYGDLNNIDMVEKQSRFDFVNLPHGIPEEFPLNFLSPYGCSKGTADQYTIDYARCFNLKTVVTRFGGIYGTYQYSYEDHGWVSFIAEMILRNKPFNRFGHGKQVRDILFVSDIVNAIDLCIKNVDKVSGQAINIAGGPNNSISVLELISLLETLTGNTEKSIINPMRQADKLVAYLDIRKAKILLGWEPFINKENGIQKLLDWLDSVL